LKKVYITELVKMIHLFILSYCYSCFMLLFVLFMGVLED